VHETFPTERAGRAAILAAVTEPPPQAASTTMNDSADVTVVHGETASASMRHSRALAVLSVVLGACSVAVLPAPLPSAFPWLTLGLSLAGVVAAVGALRARPRGRIAATLAVLGLVVSLSFPALIVFVFVRYFNWTS
jgi:hypothetical protein